MCGGGAMAWTGGPVSWLSVQLHQPQGGTQWSKLTRGRKRGLLLSSPGETDGKQKMPSSRITPDGKQQCSKKHAPCTPVLQ